MDLSKLDKVYDEILGESGESIATADPDDKADDKAEPKGDDAYKEPAYDGEDGDDGEDPRDPSTKPDKDEPDDDDDDDDDDEPEGSVEEKEEYDDIPDELVTAGRLAGFSDEEIIDLDAEQPKVLKALAAAQKKAIGPAQEKKAPPEPQAEEKPAEKPESLALKFDLPGLDDELSQVAAPVQEAFNKLLSRVEQLETGHGKTQEAMADVEKSRQADMFKQVDVFFDKQAEQLPELGNSENMNQKEVDTRIYVWNIANDLMTGSKGKIGLQEALKIGVNALRGQVSETKLKARVVSDLNKRKRKFSPRPKGRRRGEKAKGEKERGLAAIDEVLDDPKYN